MQFDEKEIASCLYESNYNCCDEINAMNASLTVVFHTKIGVICSTLISVDLSTCNAPFRKISNSAQSGRFALIL